MLLYSPYGVTASIVIKIFFIQIQIKSTQTDETSTSLLDIPKEIERMVYRRHNDDNDKEKNIDAVDTNTEVINNTDSKYEQDENKNSDANGPADTNSEEFQSAGEEQERVISDDVIEDPNNLNEETSQPPTFITSSSNDSGPVYLSSREISGDINTFGIDLRKNHGRPCITFGKTCAKIAKPHARNGHVVVATEKTYWDPKVLTNLKTKFLKLESVNGDVKASVIEGDQEMKSIFPKNLVVSKDKVTNYNVNSDKLEPIKTFLNYLRESSNMNAEDINRISFVSLKEMENRTVYVGDPPFEIESDKEEYDRELPIPGISSLRRLTNK